MRTAAIAITAVLLFTSGVAQPQAEKPRSAGSVERSALSARSFHGQFMPAKAMRVIYGNYSVKSGSSSVKDLSDHAPDLGTGEGVVRVMLDAPCSEHASNYRVLVTYAVPSGTAFDCHPCAPSVSAFLFEQHGDGWSLKNAGYDLSLGGSFGKPTPVKLIRVGASQHGLIARSQSMAQGEPSARVSIFLPSGDGFAEVFNIDRLSDNLANCKERKVDCSQGTATFEFVPDAKKEIWDIRVTGREVVNGKVATAAKVSTFEFTGGKYKVKR